MTRRLTAPLALLFVAAVLVFDLARTPPNPYHAP